MNAKKFTINTVNGTVELDIPGRYFKLLSTVSAVDVELLRDGNSVLSATAVEGGFYQRAPFNKVRITHTLAEAVSFLVAPEDGGSDRFTGTFALDEASLDAIRWADDDVRDGEAFIAHAQIAALAANFSHIQVKNPAASGKIVYVDKVTHLVGAAALGFQLRSYDTDLTTAIGAMVNKNMGGAASAGLLKSQQNGALLGTLLYYLSRPASNSEPIVLDPPIRLAEGKGLLIVPDSVNIAMFATFETRERTS